MSSLLWSLMRSSRWLYAVTMALVAGALLSAGCGGDDESAGSNTTAATGSSAVDEEARALLPPEHADSGTLKVATALNWPPFTYKGPGGDPTGIDIDIINAIAAKLGLETDITDLGDGAIIPSIQNRRFDVAVTQLVTSPERRAAVDFVEYIGNPLGLMVRSADVDKISPDDLCGRTLVATQGTGPLSFGREHSKTECVAKGKPPIKFEVFGDSGSTILALVNGRGEGFISDHAVGVYLAKTAKKDLTMDEGVIPGSDTTSGIAYSKDNPKLGEAIRAALLTSMEEGEYQKILEKWGVPEAALTEDEVRGQAGD